MKTKLLFFLLVISLVNAQQKGKGKGKGKTNITPQKIGCFKPLIIPKLTLRNCNEIDSTQEEKDKCLNENIRFIEENNKIEITNYNSQKKYDECVSKQNIASQKIKSKHNANSPVIENYADYESVYITTGDLGCSNVIPRYDYSLNTSLIVKNHGDLDLVIKLINIEDDVASRMVYIEKNSSFEIKNIPQGRYIIKEAHGEVWKQKNIDGKCVGIFTKNAVYRQGKNIPDFYIKKRIEGNYEITDIPSYELELGIKIMVKPGEKVKSTYQSNSISSTEFNK